MRDNTRTPLDRGPKGMDERTVNVESARLVVEASNVHGGTAPGELPGRRPAHTAGVFLSGTVNPCEKAQAFRSPLFSPRSGERKVTARLSPLRTVTDRTRFDLHGLSVRLWSGNNEADVTDLVTINTHPFMFRTADEFATVTNLLRSNGIKNKVNGIMEFVAASVAGDASLRGAEKALSAALGGDRPLPGRSYWGIHTFFADRTDPEDGDDVRVPYRYRLDLNQASGNTSSKGGVLQKYRNLVTAVEAGHPVTIDLSFALPWRWEELIDWRNVPKQMRLNLINPQAVWKRPEEFVMGTIELTSVIDAEAAWRRNTDPECDAMLFDPTRLTDGLHISEDPMLIALSSIYAESHMRRT